MNRGLLWLAASGLALGLAVLLALAARPTSERIEARVVSGICQQIVWQPDSPESVAARFRGDLSPTDPPVYARYRFFNITNLPDVRQGAKPALQEVGPYTYQMVRIKQGVQWVDGGAAVRWSEYRYHLFQPHLSNGTQDDPITTLNLPLLGALEYIQSLPAWKGSSLLELLATWVERMGDPRVQGLFTTRTAGELLWGYDDPLLRKLAVFAPSINPRFRLAWNMSSPEEAALDWPTQANTGLERVEDVWQYQEWEDVRLVTSWNPPHVEAVRGTDAFQFRPGLAINDSVEVWVGELYRAAKLVAEEQARHGNTPNSCTLLPLTPSMLQPLVVRLEGIPLLRLRADPAQGNPDPRFFQTIRGLMNVTSPTAAGPGGRAGKPGPPIFLSYPHFCDADPALAEGVEGLACDPQAHDLFVDVEPNTGITLRAAKRLMMSSWFGSRWRRVDPALRDTVLPIFWAELASSATPTQLQQFRPLLRARAVQRALRLYAQPVAAGLALLAAGGLCAAYLVWGSDRGGVSIGGGGDGGLAAAVAAEVDADEAAEAGMPQADAGTGGSSRDPGEAQEAMLLVPLLDSHPVAMPSEESGDG